MKTTVVTPTYLMASRNIVISSFAFDWRTRTSTENRVFNEILLLASQCPPACESISLPANVAQSEFHQIRHYDLHNVVRGNTYPTLRLSTIERAK